MKRKKKKETPDKYDHMVILEYEIYANPFLSFIPGKFLQEIAVFLISVRVGGKLKIAENTAARIEKFRKGQDK